MTTKKQHGKRPVGTHRSGAHGGKRPPAQSTRPPRAKRPAQRRPLPGAVMRGRIQGNAKGFGFFIPDDGSEDLFVPPKNLHGAMHNDVVEAVKVSSHRGAGEAEVVKILERGFKSVVGTYQDGHNCGFVLPDCNNLARDVYIPADRTGGAKMGEKVLVAITAFPEDRMPEGKVVEVLGFPGEKGVDVLSIIRAHDLRETFPKKVVAAANAVPQTVSADKLAGRRDFRNELVITIDGDDSKDFDDAVSVQKAGDDYILSVHIADVAEYVTEGSPLDEEAKRRATSVYLCDRVLPMLPVALSNGICSLNEGVDRLTLSVVMCISADGRVKSHEICEGVIRSKARMTYAKTAAILDGDDELCRIYAFLVPMLHTLRELAAVRTALRKRRGAIEFDLTESKIDIDPATGKVTDISKYPHYITHSIIEECMLLANETVAEHFTKLGCPFVYRVHLAPPPEKLEAFVDFLSALGIPFKGVDPRPGDFAELIASVDDELRPAVSRVALRTMSKAEYKPQDAGHFGLAAPYYCHFTSPIRRYPDLSIHRIIKTYLHGGRLDRYEDFVAESSRISSERERAAEATEREVDDLKKAEYMSDKIGCTYDGVISGVTEWGLFVELENSVEGLVRTESLPGGGYTFNAALLRMDNRDHSYRIGDRMTIVVEGVRDSKISLGIA